MSRTNIGTDYLTKDADYSLSQGSSVSRDIVENNDIISKVSTSTATTEDYAKADALIQSVDAELKNVANIADMTDKEYIKHTTKDYLTFSGYENSENKMFVLESVLGSTLVFFMLLCVVYYLMDEYIRRREDDSDE
jgi:hypothetical protein